jgi:hypothetical protein
MDPPPDRAATLICETCAKSAEGAANAFYVVPRKDTKVLLQADPSWITAGRMCMKNNTKLVILDQVASGWFRGVVGASVGASR